VDMVIANNVIVIVRRIAVPLVYPITLCVKYFISFYEMITASQVDAVSEI
jgi:hypothetical protein